MLCMSCCRGGRDGEGIEEGDKAVLPAGLALSVAHRAHIPAASSSATMRMMLVCVHCCAVPCRAVLCCADVQRSGRPGSVLHPTALQFSRAVIC